MEKTYRLFIYTIILHKEKRNIVLPKVYNALYSNRKIIIDIIVLNMINRNLYNAVSALYWYINKEKLEKIDYCKNLLSKYWFKI